MNLEAIWENKGWVVKKLVYRFINVTNSKEFSELNVNLNKNTYHYRNQFIIQYCQGLLISHAFPLVSARVSPRTHSPGLIKKENVLLCSFFVIGLFRKFHSITIKTKIQRLKHNAEAQWQFPLLQKTLPINVHMLAVRKGGTNKNMEVKKGTLWLIRIPRCHTKAPRHECGRAFRDTYQS